MSAWPVLLGLALSLYCQLLRAGEDPTELRILSYNIHHAEGVDGKLDLERIARVIRESAADIVALQEVDRHVSRSNSVDQAAELAKRLQMHVAFGGNITLQGGDYGNAILARWPIAFSQNHVLPCIGQGEQRGVLQAVIHPPGSPAITLLATHFDHRRDEEERLASVKFVNGLLDALQAEHPSSLFLLAGDINATRSSQTFQNLNQRWEPTNSSELATIPVAEPQRQIDFIFHAKVPAGDASQLEIVETDVIEETLASDHRPILTRLRLKK